MVVLRQVFQSSYIKTITVAEIDAMRSNQHEFHGVYPLINIFGRARRTENATFKILGQNVEESAEITWYDSRERHETRSEFRLYYQNNSVIERAEVGDNIQIAIDSVGAVHCILHKTGSSYSRWTSNI